MYNKKAVFTLIGLVLDIASIIVMFIFKDKVKINFDYFIVGSIVSTLIGLLWIFFGENIMEKYVRFYSKDGTEPSIAFNILYYGIAFLFLIFPIIIAIIWLCFM